MLIRLIHIVPQLPPNISGVGDYAVVLGRRILEETSGGVRSEYVSAGYKHEQSPCSCIAHIDLAGQQSAEALVNVILGYEDQGQRVCVLLHYVGYGYDKRGCPVWLLQAVRQLRLKWLSLRLITMFHELYAASNRPWESAFWTTPVQRRLAAAIAGHSDGIMTNRTASAQWLRRQVNGQPIMVSPIFSNVGEPEALPLYTEREPHAVVFGASAAKTKIYQEHGEALSQVLARTRIKTIIDIGAPVSKQASKGLKVPIESTGLLSADEVSAYLQRASLGVLRYPLAFITKSGTMAAYMAHGVPPLIVDGGGPVNEMQEEQHYSTLDMLMSKLVDRSTLAAISENVRARYIATVHSRHAVRKLTALLDIKARSQMTV